MYLLNADVHLHNEDLQWCNVGSHRTNEHLHLQDVIINSMKETVDRNNEALQQLIWNVHIIETRILQTFIDRI
jgi:hypothetical protein